MRTTVWSAALLQPGEDGLTVVGQLGQSLDGQIATSTGQSKYINGHDGLVHLHKLRAWADVVVIGVGTLIADDPKLTVRLIDGRDPARVVIDPSARSLANAACLSDQSVKRIILTAAGKARKDWPAGVEQVEIQSVDSTGRFDPHQVRHWLAAQGWRRVLVEGGAATLAGFLGSGNLDYLHLITSPSLLGPGTSGIRVAGASSLAECPRFKAQSFGLGQDLLIECGFH